MPETRNERRRFLTAAGIGLGLPMLESVNADGASSSLPVPPARRFAAIGTYLGFHTPNCFYQKQSDGKVLTRSGPKVVSGGQLPDGTVVRDVTDLKQYLVTNIELFGTCLAGKLLVYGTGRKMNYADRSIMQEVASAVRFQGNGFRDLIVAVVLSESFRTK